MMATQFIGNPHRQWPPRGADHRRYRKVLNCPDCGCTAEWSGAGRSRLQPCPACGSERYVEFSAYWREERRPGWLRRLFTGESRRGHWVREVDDG